MRVLVDQSGYDLQNLGDVAMLQGCVAGLQHQWPTAQIDVVCHRWADLERYCPGTTRVDAAPAERVMPAEGAARRLVLGAGQVAKALAPYVGVRRLHGPGDIVDSVTRADAVVAAGGGYVCDTWWWHAMGVLSVLDLAQRLRIPTAMFGQGLGPLTHPLLTRQARRVLPRLDVLGLREGLAGPALARDLGVDPTRVTVTGDDALAAAVATAVPDPAGDVIGFGARVAEYARVDSTAARTVAGTLAAAAREHDAPVIALPVSRYAAQSDLAAMQAAWDGGLPPGSVAADVRDPRELVRLAARCRVVVAGSYHAAVFSLARGVPVVCLTNSRYYAGKFEGLRGMFPEATSVVAVSDAALPTTLSAAIAAAWDLDEEARETTRQRARRQAADAGACYARFAAVVAARGTATDTGSVDAA